jgi:hypothetical protein
MGFAKIILGEDDDERDSPTSGAIPGDAGCPTSDPQLFRWITTPSPEVLRVAIEAYFDRVNWYIMIFHRPSFFNQAEDILRRSAWRRDELCDVMLVAIVAALGLRCVEYDATWHGHQFLEAYSLTAKSVGADLMAQIGSRFYEVMLHTQIEAHQICMLLSTYHVYFGSSDFAWNVSGVNTKTAYALALHCDKTQKTDKIAREIGNRCWNHLIVGDQFMSMIFGRPAGLDPAFAQLKSLAEMDDTELPESVAVLPILQRNRGQVSFLTYHVLKYELYHIIRQALQSFRMLQLQSPASVQDLQALIGILDATETMLARWHDKLPAVFKPSQWSGDDPWNDLRLDQCSEEERTVRRKLGLQGLILNLLYDAAIVWAHRPLLKLRISISPAEGKSKLAQVDMPDSLGTSVQAALRMSRAPVQDFEGHLGQSFVLMHLFTAGVILCVAPTCHPYSQMASDAKSGVLKIIAACRATKDESKIARHTDRMLTKLYQKTMQREMDNALRTANVDVHRSRKPQPGMDRPMPSEARSVGAFSPLSKQTSRPQSDILTPMADSSMASDAQSAGYESRRVEELPAEPVVSYLQFESFRHPESIHAHIDEHLDEAYGAFEQSKHLTLVLDVLLTRTGSVQSRFCRVSHQCVRKHIVLVVKPVWVGQHSMGKIVAMMGWQDSAPK